MRRFFRYAYCLLCLLVFASCGRLVGYAAYYKVYQADDLEGYEASYVASDSDADLSVYGSYGSPYDGSISTTYTAYFSGVVEKLSPGMHYVLFRSDQYNYRLVYDADLSYSDGVFSAVSAKYVNYYVGQYNSRSQVTSGDEGAFTLSTSGYPVYSDLGDLFPSLFQGVKNYEIKALLLVAVLGLLINLLRSFFGSSGRTI